MVATVTFIESNTTSAQEFGVTTTNWGSTNASDLVALSNPITAGTNSFEKWHRFLVYINAASKVSNFRVYASSMVLPTGVSLYTSASVGGTPVSVFATPATTALVATLPILTALPGAANVGIGGSMTGSITTTTGKSDWFVHQIQTAGTATSGASGFELTVTYDEVT